MAEHGAATEFTPASGNDIAAHEGTYHSFLGIVKWVTAGLVVLLILMAAFLV